MMKNRTTQIKLLTCIGLLFVLYSCVKTPIAPVEELEVNKLATFDYYYVASGDTLYSIAFLENRDYRDLAKWNDIEAPYTLKRGQKIYINEPENFYENRNVLSSDTPVFVPNVAATQNGDIQDPSQQNPNIQNPGLQDTGIAQTTAIPAPTPTGKTSFDNTWLWPVQQGYESHNKSTQNNGLDIFGVRGSPVIATAAGSVVYSGNGLKGYGNMVIIKHNDNYLSAYAHNDNLLVAENEQVTQGQQIASLGATDSNAVKLHFEVRNDGEPIQPLSLLPSR